MRKSNSPSCVEVWAEQRGQSSNGHPVHLSVAGWVQIIQEPPAGTKPTCLCFTIAVLMNLQGLQIWTFLISMYPYLFAISDVSVAWKGEESKGDLRRVLAKQTGHVDIWYQDVGIARKMLRRFLSSHGLSASVWWSSEVYVKRRGGAYSTGANSSSLANILGTSNIPSE